MAKEEEMKGAKRGSQEQESTFCKSSTKGRRPGSCVCAGGVRGRMRVSARAHVCARNHIHFSCLGAGRREGRASRVWSWFAGCPSCKSALISGLQLRAQLHGGPQITSKWLARRGGCRKPGQNPRVRSYANNGSTRSRDSFRV